MFRLHHLAGVSLAAITASLVLVTVVPTVLAAPRPLTLEVPIGAPCVFGTAGDNATIQLTWKSANGSLKAKTNVQANSYDGRWGYCSDGSPVVQVGDVIRVSDGTTTRKWAIPLLTVLQNRTKQTYRGRGPAGDYIRVFCPGPLGGTFEPCISSWKVKVSTRGQWSLRHHVMGGDRVVVEWKGNGLTVDASSVAPYIGAAVGSSFFTGFANSQTVHVQLFKGADLVATGTATRKADGSFAGHFKNKRGHRVNVTVGEHVVADIAADAQFDTFALTAVADPVADQITGQCPYDPYDPSSPVSGVALVNLYRNGSLLDWDAEWLHDDGSFDIDWRSLGTGGFRASDRVLAGCQLSSGDFVEVWATMQ